MDPDLFAARLIACAGVVKKNSGAKKVVMGHLLPRFVSDKFHISENEAADNRDWAAQVNIQLSIQTDDINFITIWDHNYNFTCRSQHLLCDGVHLNDDGQKKLYKSLRGALTSVCRNI